VTGVQTCALPIFRRGFAQVGDAEGEQEARQGGGPAGRDAGDQVLRPARGELAGDVDRQVRAQEGGVLPRVRFVGKQRLPAFVQRQRAAAVGQCLEEVGGGGGIERGLHPHQVLDRERVEVGG